LAENGNKRKVYLTDGKGTGTFVWVAGETSSNLSLQRNMIETSDKNSMHATFVAGRQSGTASVTVNLDDSATDSQRKMVKAFYNGQTVFVFMGELNDGGETQRMVQHMRLLYQVLTEIIRMMQ
jgi:predicted secreted protein